VRTLFRCLSLLVSEAMKNVAKVPGWVPVAAMCLALSHLLLPDKLTILGDTVATPKEVIALLATAMLYAIGDVVDEIFFDDCTRRLPPLCWVRIEVMKCLRMRRGIYRVSHAIVSAAGRYERTAIQMKNEAAKFARSLIFQHWPALVCWHWRLVCWSRSLLYLPRLPLPPHTSISRSITCWISMNSLFATS
jgi:hypothetical protein